MKQESFFKLAEVQKLLNVSRATLWRLRAERGLMFVKIGGVTRIRESDLQLFLARHESKPPCNGAANGAVSEVSART